MRIQIWPLHFVCEGGYSTENVLLFQRKIRKGPETSREVFSAMCIITSYLKDKNLKAKKTHESILHMGVSYVSTKGVER